MSALIKTEGWPDGRRWPDKLTLDVGSNMPLDVYGVYKNGVTYIRCDVATKREQKARLDALREAAEIARTAAHRLGGYQFTHDAILARIKEVEG